MDAPKYDAGSVIDLRFSKDTMPDRLYVEMVYRKPKSTEWMYQVRSEMNNGGMKYMSESQIIKHASHKNSKCYKHEKVKKMYDSGFRFCGNSKSDVAYSRANKYKSANYINHIILTEAIDSDGNIIEDQLGLWVQYRSIISTTDFTSNGYHMIK